MNTFTYVYAENTSLVFINDKATEVFFNDGDSFRVISGPMTGTKARLAGFNTLESNGPVHAWGDWHPYELYYMAKQATLNARRGIWHCYGSLDNRDGYGRVLFDCPDLVQDQLRKGLAHALQVDDVPAIQPYLMAQQEAIAARRGIWAHGVPRFVLTSTHAASERPDKKYSYNRLVSTRDGHSEKMQHQEDYPECTQVCHTSDDVNDDELKALVLDMRNDKSLGPKLAPIANLLLLEMAERFIRTSKLPAYTPDTVAADIISYLNSRLDAGTLPQTHAVQGACMTYVPFERWYTGAGKVKAKCLDKRGYYTGPWHKERAMQQAHQIKELTPSTNTQETP